MSNEFFSPDCLKGRVVLITGASSGIGAATAKRMAQCGARLVLSGRDATRLRSVADEAHAEAVVPADLALDGAAESLAETVSQKFGAIDGLVNSAGVGAMKPTAKLSAREIDLNLAVNVRATLLLSGRLGAGMAAQKRGTIINISSVVGSIGTPLQAAYAATKGAIDAMTRSMANEFGPSGVRVNAIAPGAINTEMWGGRLEDPAFAAAVRPNIALGTIAEPEAIADAVVFLASDAARYITGEVLLVDGGLVRTGHIVSPSYFAKYHKEPGSKA